MSSEHDQHGTGALPPQAEAKPRQTTSAAIGQQEPAARIGPAGPSADLVQRKIQRRVLQRKAVKGNDFGDWDINQANTDGGPGKAWASDVAVKFVPDRGGKVKASEIAFVQTFNDRHNATGKPGEDRPNFRERMAEDGTRVDRIDSRKHGWYGYNNDGKPGGTVTPGSAPAPYKEAVLSDKPSWDQPVDHFFETAAIAKAGEDQGKVYGALTWGFDVDDKLKLTSHEPKHLDKQSGSFDKAVAKWNEQAKGDEAKRNHPDQQQLGPFK